MLRAAAVSFTDDAAARVYEQRSVHDVYEAIASHFSDTRYKPWPTIETFLEQLEPGSAGLDAGCGNGKYLGVRSALRGAGPALLTGLDRSSGLVAIAAQRGHEVLVGDALNLPYRDACFDFAICIATLHHFASASRRLAAVSSLLRVLRPRGKLLIQVWALEQGDETNLSRRRQTNESSEDEETVRGQQDVLVPWKRRDGGAEEARYYHLFREGELAALVKEAGGEVVQEGWVKGNWYVEAKRAA